MPFQVQPGKQYIFQLGVADGSPAGIQQGTIDSVLALPSGGAALSATEPATSDDVTRALPAAAAGLHTRGTSQCAQHP